MLTCEEIKTQREEAAWKQNYRFCIIGLRPDNTKRD